MSISLNGGPLYKAFFGGFSGGSSGFQFASGFPRGDSAVRSWTSPGVGREWTETGLKPDRNRTAEAGLAILKTNWAATGPNSGPKPDQDQANTGPKSARNLTETGPKLERHQPKTGLTPARHWTDTSPTPDRTGLKPDRNRTKTGPKPDPNRIETGPKPD